MNKTEFSVKQEKIEVIGRNGVERVELLLEVKCKIDDILKSQEKLSELIGSLKMNKVKKISLILEILD